MGIKIKHIKYIGSITLASFLFSSTALAQESSIDWSTVKVPETPTEEKPVGAAISPMKKDQKAPFTGVLLSPEAVSSVIVTYLTLPQQIAIATEAATNRCKAESDRKLADKSAECTRITTIDASRYKTQSIENARLADLVVKYEKRESSRLSAGTWIGIGIVSGVIATVGTIYLVNQATK